MSPLLILDVHYLCHRAFHTTKGLSYKERPTGVIFGFLKTLTSLKNEFNTDKVAFCFEHHHLYRRDVYPPYKRKRSSAERTDEERKAYEGLTVQIAELRRRYLPRIGFQNIFCYRGMESDDIMAKMAARVDGDVILVTSDSDMFQCLGPNVKMFSPNKRVLYSEDWFRRVYGIRPRRWAKVKAIAGCPTDEVEGIKGVGEHTALQYVRGELNPKSKTFQRIESAEGRAIILRNLGLVMLPHEACPLPDVVEDKVDLEGWKDVCRQLGFQSIALVPPMIARRKSIHGK